MSRDYQKEILEEYVQYGGSARSAANIMRTINTTFQTVDQIQSGSKETVLKAVLMERKNAINSSIHLTDGQKAILNRYLHGVYRRYLEALKDSKK